MVVRCTKESLNIYRRSGISEEIAAKFDCSPIQASLLEMRGVTADTSQEEVSGWLAPSMTNLLETLDLGEKGRGAAELISSLTPSSRVIVYGDYDVDGISATAVAIELVISRGAHVRYFIPHRFNQGYGFHKNVAGEIVKYGCDLVIVVDCGSQDAAAVEVLKSSGIPVVIFDHHLVEGTLADADSLINPQISGDSAAKKLCAAAVLWCWIWQNKLLPEESLLRVLDVVALATIADCVSLASPLNRVLVREGLRSIRTNTRPGLSILMEQLGISPASVDTEDLAMKVIPCLNAAGRLYLADLAEDILFPGENLALNVSRLIALNRRRRELSSKILDQVSASEGDYRYVLTNSEWSVGVLSSVASRICGERNSPIALVASVGDIMRGTLRMPADGDAVGVLKQISPLLNTWGGHRLAAGFSVKAENWEKVRDTLEEMLSLVKPASCKEDLLCWEPEEMDIDTWSEACALGPFGMGNPFPLFYSGFSGSMNVVPLGKTGKHVRIDTGAASLLAFGAADMFGGTEDIEGWVYKPRIDTWHNVTSLQFVLEKMVIR